MTHDIVSALDALTVTLSAAFQARSARNFALVVRGVVLCLGRPTVTNLARSVGEPRPDRPSRLHRFFSRAAWVLEDLFKLLLVDILIPRFAPTGEVVFAGDDTTAGKCGRKVAFAGRFRDAVASTAGKAVTHWAHTWVVVCLIVPCPFAQDRLLHLPVMARLYRREADCDAAHPFRTRSEMIIEMITLISGWLAARRIILTVDGAYPTKELFASVPTNVAVVSRIRRDAALYELPPERRPGQRGRPRLRGARLPKLETIATAAEFSSAEVLQYGKRRRRLIASVIVLWYSTSKRPLRVVIVRDPDGHEHDDFFLSTDLDLAPARIAELYAGRWGVEEAIRESKQSLGFDEVQSWSRKAVERQAAFVLVVHTMVQVAFLDSMPAAHDLSTVPSFARMLTRLRIEIWRHRISNAFALGESSTKVLALLEDTLLTAA